MIKRYNFLIEPLEEQKISLAKLFGCTRVVFNDSLAYAREQFSNGNKYPGANNFQKLFITQAKRTKERYWLGEVSAAALQYSIRHLDVAYKNFFNSCKNKHKGKKINLPKFKSRKSKQSASFGKNGFVLRGTKLYLAKIGEIKVIWSRDLPNYPTTVTIEKTKSGKYSASFVCETEPKVYPESNSAIGVDLGIKDFAVLSNGERISAPRPLRENIKKLKKLQREFSRTEKGSNRREKKRISLAKLYQHISNIRLDFLHKLTSRLIKENQFIALEDLNVAGMLKNRKLSRAISDLGLGRFREMLISKAEEANREVVKISRWFPSSKQCNTCGNINSELTLGDREWTCEHCETIHDRDLNAARNILDEGLRILGKAVAGGHSETLNEHGENVRPLSSKELKANLCEVLTPFSDKTVLRN